MRILWLTLSLFALISPAYAAPPACVEGQTKPAVDGCNTCACQRGIWMCTLMYCFARPGEACQDDWVRPSEDGCNTCTCSDGAWGCTEMACPPR